MQEAIGQLRADGMNVRPDDLAASQLPRAIRLLPARHRPQRRTQAIIPLGSFEQPYAFLFRSAAQALPNSTPQEFRHLLARRVCHGYHGEIRKAHRYEQEEQLGVLGLTLNAIALWNSTYIQAAIEQLTREGWNIGEADIARVSPLLFKHINFLGRYAFNLPKAIADGQLRPLRNPNSE